MLDQATLASLEANYRANQPQQQPKTQPKQNNRKSWLSAIPSIAAAGASFIPGVGTAGAAALGGGGELARQLLNGEKVNLGNVGKEAALSAIPGGLGKIGKFALKGTSIGADVTKAAKIVKDTEKVAQIGDNAAQSTKVVNAGRVRDISSSSLPVKKIIPQSTSTVTPPESVIPSSMLSRVKSRMPTPAIIPTDGTLLSNAGNKLRAANRGIQAGDKIGKEVLDENRAKELNNAISGATKGITGRTIRGQVKGVQQAKQVAGAELDAAAEASKGVVAPKVKASISKGVADDREKILGFDPANKAHIDLNNRYAKRLDSANTAKDILDARRTFSQAAKKVYTNPDATQTLDKELASVYYKHANKLLDNLAPEVRAADKKFSTLTDAEKALTSNKSNVNASGVKPFGTSINGRGVGGGTLQATTDTAGKTLEAIGGNSASARFGRGLTGQVATRLATAPFATPATPVETSNSNPNTTIEEEVLPASTQISTSASDTQTPDTNNANQINQALQTAMIQALGKGDYQGITAIKSVMDTFAKQQETANKPLNSTTSGIIADTKTGLNQLSKLSSNIADNNANNPLIGLVRGKNPLDTNAQNLQASIATAKQIVGKALEGGVLRAEDEKKYAKILPTINDTDAVAQHKISQLIDLISNRLDVYQSSISGGSGGTDLASIGL